jgi:uncharacterized low-complexity protein
MTKPVKKTPVILSAALLATLGLGQAASADTSDSVFSAQDLERGYMATASEGKCGEGKCGEDGEDGEKDDEGKCGEGKCGGTSV